MLLKLLITSKHTLLTHVCLSSFMRNEEKEGPHRLLLLNTKTRWISRVFEIREPSLKFLSEKKSLLTAHFIDKVWIAKLAYLCDICSQLSELNLSI